MSQRKKAHAFGTPIVANGDPEQVGFVVSDDGDKSLVLVKAPGVTAAQFFRLAHREPKDYDDRGAGGTYKLA